MHLNIPHKFTKAEAIQKVKQVLDDSRSQLAGKAEIKKETWQGDTLDFAFTAQGQSVSGTLEVTDSAFVLDAKLPFMLRMFEGKIEKMIQEQSKQMLK